MQIKWGAIASVVTIENVQKSEGGIGGRDEGAEEGRKSMTRRGGASTLVSSLALLLHAVA